jgi:hypothetical protein
MNPDQPEKNYNAMDEPVRLVRLVKDGDVRTSGEWNAWCRHVIRVHYKIRPWIWRQLETVLSKDALKYLKERCEK